ncbi:MAG: hypothetical protein HY821_07070 [Acidobacteria bacterium]|nr:hypothetical protein [Acidobacteriota bacterium]
MWSIALLSFLLMAQAESPAWERLSQLAGEWEGVGSGAPGEAQGRFTIAFDLQKQILVRRNWAEYPATAQRKAFRHDDLMVIYREAGAVKAEYFDNEGHVIRYTVSASGERIVFLGDAVAGQPRFRFTYTIRTDGELGIEFEIAGPDAQEKFEPYIQARARRKAQR